MKFHVHTLDGVITVDAKNPADAIIQVKAVNPKAQIKKVKLAGGQRDARKNEHAKLS